MWLAGLLAGLLAICWLQFNATLDSDLQELDLGRDREELDRYRAYTGGFPSLWRASQF